MMFNLFDQMAKGEVSFWGKSDGETTGAGFPMGWVDSVEVGDQWNAMVDRIISATHESPEECDRVFAEIEQQLSEPPLDGSNVGWLVGKVVLGLTPRKEGTEFFKSVMFQMFTPAFRNLNDASQRQLVIERNLRLALAARKFEIENKQLPAEIEQLAPLVPAEVLIDPLTGENLLFEFITERGGEPVEGQENPVLRIYSVGQGTLPPEIWRIELTPLDQLENKKSIPATADQ